MISNPSFKMKSYSGGSMVVDFVATEGRYAHALRITGNGTITVTDASGNNDTHDVKDGEVIICLISAITAVSGPTKIRAQFPRDLSKHTVG